MKKKKEKIVCNKCNADYFKSWSGLTQHKTKMHPYIPPPLPKRETVVETGEMFLTTLIGGRKLNIGDVFWHGRKMVITKITYTEGSNDVEVEARITKRWWSESELS